MPPCKYTPDIAELLPVREYRCEQCADQVFYNQSHYQMHLRRRHHLTAISYKVDISAYYCPVEKCMYNAEVKGARHFTNLRLLRQHYQKRHMIKQFKCLKCNETFLLERHLERHQCCNSYPCPVCELTYTSKASLQTHMRRKNHHQEPTNETMKPEVAPSLPKVAILSIEIWKKSQQQQQQPVIPANTVLPAEPIHVTAAEGIPTIPAPPFYSLPSLELPSYVQAESAVSLERPIHSDINVHNPGNELPLPSFTDEEVERLLRDMETQTDDVDLDNIDMNNEVLHCNIQTQTRDTRQNQGTMTELDVDEDYGTYQGQEQLFATQTSSDMHTQTPDTRQNQGTMTEIDLVEQQKDVPQQNDYDSYQEQEQLFGTQTSTNMHTQTRDTTQNQGTMTELVLEAANEPVQQNDYGAYQEQMFGTQTSAHMHTQTCDELFEELGLSHIQTQTPDWPDSLYNTQHTQTCDNFIDDFLENFQSTYTQTMWLDWQETEGTGD